MIISKESMVSKALNELRVSSKTPNASTVIRAVEFVNGKGLYFTMDSSVRTIFVKDSNVDFNAKINSNIFVPAILSELENNDVTITFENDSIKFGCWSFEASYSKDYRDCCEAVPFITFTKEQFAKLEKDFYLTIGNYFQNSKNTDTIMFAVKQGAVYQVAPGCGLYKISKVNGLVDEVQFSQNFGHETIIFLFPHKLFDLLKFDDNIKLTFDKECGRIIITSNNMIICYQYPFYGTTVFEKRLASKDIESELTLKSLNPISSKLKGIVKNSFEDNEDLNISINYSDGKISASIDELQFSTEASASESFSFNVNSAVLSYILNELPEDTKFKKVDNHIVFMDSDNNSYFVNNSEIV